MHFIFLFLYIYIYLLEISSLKSDGDTRVIPFDRRKSSNIFKTTDDNYPTLTPLSFIQKFILYYQSMVYILSGLQLHSLVIIGYICFSFQQIYSQDKNITQLLVCNQRIEKKLILNLTQKIVVEESAPPIHLGLDIFSHVDNIRRVSNIE